MTELKRTTIERLERVLDNRIAKAQTDRSSSSAEVTDVDSDGTVWVHVFGGADKTPVASTSVNVQPGDVVPVETFKGDLYIPGNYSSPAASSHDLEVMNRYMDSISANADKASEMAEEAEKGADSAKASAARAETAADNAHTYAENAYGYAEDAFDKAEEASEAALNANVAANGALVGLSTVQDVIGVLNWASENGTFVLTSDTQVTPGKTYWTRSGSGTDADPYVYTPVATPDASLISTYYEVSGVDTTMDDYITSHLALTDDGLFLLKDGSGYRLKLTDSGAYIIDIDGNDVNTMNADGNTIGRPNESRQILDYHSLKLVDKEETVYFHVSDLRERDGYATITERFVIGYGNTENYFVVSFSVASLDTTSATINGNPVVVTGVWRDWNGVELAENAVFGDVVLITYKTASQEAKAFTFGNRTSGSAIGGFSSSLGRDNIASGTCSHAEGRDVEAAGDYSHGEGRSSQSLGRYSHAEGYYTIAKASHSHTEGLRSKATGEGAHAQGWYTIAAKPWQFTLGKFNVEDDSQDYNGKYAVILGNGANDLSRSNAATIDWDGNAWFDGEVSADEVSATDSNDVVHNLTEKTRAWYARCYTTAATAAKTVTLSGFNLQAGVIVYILFTYTNTANNATLNVNGTGAYLISASNSTTVTEVTWSAEETVAFMFDGTYWRMLASKTISKMKDIEAGAQVNTITGVKGNAESSYRTGNVNLTPVNIGAVDKTGDTMTGLLNMRNNKVRMTNTNVTSNVAPSSTTYMSPIEVYDSAGNRVGFLEEYFTNDGIQRIQLVEQRVVNGNTLYNVIGVGIKSDGTFDYVIGNPAIFRQSISAMGAQYTNGYWGLMAPDGNTSGYIRAPSNGFIPYQAGGNGYLGTEGWPWNYGYFKNLMVNNNSIRGEWMQATGSGTKSTAAGTITPMSLTSQAASPNSGMSLTGGSISGIKVSVGGYYRIMASMYVSGSNATYKGVYIKKNNSDTGNTGEIMGLTMPYTMAGVQCGPKLIWLNANDVLYLAGRLGGVAGSIDCDNAQTYLLVERVT